jgi:hypothetical protein
VLARHQSAASLANRIAGVIARRASASNTELHQLACVVPGNAPVKAVVLYTNWLTPGFKSDWQEHISIQVQTAPSNFLALASKVSVSATPAYQQFLSQSCKNP